MQHTEELPALLCPLTLPTFRIMEASLLNLKTFIIIFIVLEHLFFMQLKVGQTHPGHDKSCVLLTKLNHQERSFPMNCLSQSLFVFGGEKKDGL